jgi:hypothetical protein
MREGFGEFSPRDSPHFAPLTSQNAEREKRSQRHPGSRHLPLVVAEKDSVKMLVDSDQVVGRTCRGRGIVLFAWFMSEVTDQSP